MRHLRLFCATVALVSALTFSAQAGNIECDGYVSTPQDTPTEETAAPQDDMHDSLTEAILIVIEAALALP